MSVVCYLETGAFLDHFDATTQHYKPYLLVEARAQDAHCHCEIREDLNEKKLKGCRWKAELFSITSPFMMDSQAQRIQREGELADHGADIRETSAQRKRKKKAMRKTTLSRAESRISEVIDKALHSLVARAKESHHIKEVQTVLRLADNNSEARVAAQIPGCGDLFQVLCSEFDEQGNEPPQDMEPVILCRGNGESFKGTYIIGRCMCNTDINARIIKIDNHKFIIPSQSSFLTSSFQHLVSCGYSELLVSGGYDLIVIDPPWLNKSVKRKKSYQMVEESDLKRLPLQELTGEDCLVCVWVTNNERLLHFVKDELFPHWSVEWVADWIWMKVTRSGEPVCDMSSPHKKPYEQLIIGRIKKHPIDSDRADSKTSDISVSSITANANPVFEESGVSITSLEELAGHSACKPQQYQVNRGCERPSLPQNFLLVSIPCALHSKKPPLADVLSKYLPSHPRCLELFARNLTPGWMSWGCEPLCHQHIDYFEQDQDC